MAEVGRFGRLGESLNALTELNGANGVEDSDAINGQNRGLLLGKDREVFHASIDLRRAWSRLTDRSLWIELFQRVVKTISHVSGNDENQDLFKEIAIEMVFAIQKNNPDSRIKLFQGTLKQAEQFARRKGRFIVLYIEDGSPSLNQDSRSAQACDYFRKAFAENYLADVLNEKFVFFAGSSAHVPTNNIAKMLGYTRKDLPLFAILTPGYVDAPPRQSDKRRMLPEVIVTLRLPTQDIDGNKVQRFLQRVLEVHGPLLATKKREFDELLTAEQQISIMGKKLRDVDDRVSNESRRRTALLRNLGPEPPRQNGTIKLSIHMKGKKIERRFFPNDPASSVITWADAHGLTADLDELSTRQSINGKIVVLRYSELVGKLTSLQDMGIIKDSTLMVQPSSQKN